MTTDEPDVFVTTKVFVCSDERTTVVVRSPPVGRTLVKGPILGPAVEVGVTGPGPAGVFTPVTVDDVTLVGLALGPSAKQVEEGKTIVLAMTC